VTLSLEGIRAAAHRIAPYAVRTRLLTTPALDAATGAHVLVKPEVLQRTGSFKIRGAMSRMTLLTPEERGRGVVAFSSGNHAQAVAYAARILEAPAVIVMPADAPAMKIANTRGYGADVVLYDRYTEDREAIGRRLASERGLTLVPPFDDAAIMAGQGTAGLEIAEDASEMGLKIDAALVCCSGGGLAAGMATALSALHPGVQVYAVEPEGFDDTARSLIGGERVANSSGAKSICDALLVDRPGALTFAVNRRLLAGGLAVSDAEVRHAMRFAFEHLKLVVEPGGAAALAALLAKKTDVKGRTVAVILSGGNVDPALFADVLKDRP
jgi:threonine dehydratase